MPAEPLPELRVFVYGTLKAGEANAALAAGAQARIAAAVPGTLYHHPAGYPMLDAPAAAVLGRASGEAEPDRARFRAAAEAHDGAAAPRDGALAHGELLSFAERDRRLALFDELEDFDPADLAASEYHRVLLPIRVGPERRLRVAWGYVMPADSPWRGRLPPVPGGTWRVRR